MMKLLGRFVGSLVAASVVIFVLLRIVPGDPARVALGTTATDAAVAKLTAQLGTDRPLIVQYFSWIGGLLRGNFGISLATRKNITPLVLDRMQVSAILCGVTMALTLLIAVPLGMYAARRRSAVVDIVTQIGVAVPSFLVAILLVAAFMGVLPANGWVPPNQGFGAFVEHLILPVISLTLVQTAIMTRYVRGEIFGVMHMDHIRTARSLGLSWRQALTRHGLRLAAVPILTIAGLQLTSLIVGAVVIERVFVIPGLGSMLLDAVSNRDLTTVQSIVMLLVFVTLTVNLVVDVLARVIDPRMKEER